MNCLMTAWHQHEAELRGWLRHRLRNATDAEDLLQDVFIKAMRQGERFCAIVNARAWLYECQRSPNNGQLWSLNFPHPSLTRSRRDEFV